jgi:hypothetical protein
MSANEGYNFLGQDWRLLRYWFFVEEKDLNKGIVWVF